ncbi:hypothetical protein B0T19DRAFT_442821 [Cercophora scortea]|uniref:Orc1-like AAA ATPase domain-containing protein n=1 Tax=Cercophora scortea TaxID=314031 RepID=A0AAE0IEJ3_9PEZI|nr:hypothetical protein B0T19DRAFT_442821 [Cercophora scortea]
MNSSANPPPKPEHYGIAWICTLDSELAAAGAMLDEHHRDLQEPQDNNAYVLGSIGNNNIVVARLPDSHPGTTSSAADGVTELLARFPKIRFSILVGIGSGVPGDKFSVHLGDVVIGNPTRNTGGVFQYSHDETIAKGAFETIGELIKPPPVLVAAVQNLKTDHLLEVTKIPNHFEQMVTKHPDMQGKYTYPGTAYDTLYEASYEHPASNDRCHTCDKFRVVPRRARYSPEKPKAHYGTIASGDEKLRRGSIRDQLARQTWRDVLCFETAAFGLMHAFPCLVLRGVCDYADSHSTNKLWNEYAAAAAAAYAKEIVLGIRPEQVRECRTAVEFMVDAETKFDIPFDRQPFPRIHQFIGRSHGLETLDQMFMPLKENKHPKLLVLHGAGGIGKTQMAIEFARRHREQFSAVFFIDGRTKELLRSGLAAMIDQLPFETPSLRRMVGPLEAYDDSIQRAIRIVARWLALPKNYKWLLIIDNVDAQNWVEQDEDEEEDMSFADASREADAEAESDTAIAGPEKYDIRPYLDLYTKGSIFITTRLSKMAQLGLNASTEALSLDDGLNMLKSLDPRTEHEQQDATELVDTLHKVPLTLVFASAIMKDAHLTSRQYLHHLNAQLSRHHHLLASNPRLRAYHPTLTATLELSLTTASEENPRAVELLWVFSLLYHGDLFPGLFANATAAHNHWLHSNPNSLFQNLIDVLEKYEFVQLNSAASTTVEEAAYSMHPLVQEWCRDRLEMETEGEDERGEYLFRAFDIMARAIPDPMRRTRQEHMFRRRLLPHADRLVGWYARSPEMHGKLDTTLRIFGNLFADAGRLELARRIYERVLPVCQVAFTGDRNVVPLVRLMCRLASVYKLQGRLMDAGAVLHRAILVFEESKLWGRDNLPYILTAIELAKIYMTLREYEMAQKILVSLTHCELDPPIAEEYAPIATAMMDLAALLMEKGQLAEAATLYGLTMQRLQKRLGGEHRYMYRCMGGLGAVYEAQGKLVEAAEEYQKALVGLQRLLGADHEKTVTLSLALYHLRNGLLKSPETRRILILDQRTMVATEAANAQDPLHNRLLTVVMSKLNLAISLAANSEFHEAGVLLKTIHRAAKRYFRTNRELLITVLSALGDWHVRQNQFSEARTRLEAALDIARDIYDADDLHTVDLLGRLGDVYTAEGDLDTAESAYERAVESMSEILGPDSLDAMLLVFRLGCLYRRKGRAVDAEAEVTRAVRCFEDVLGLAHPQTMRATEELRVIREEQGGSVDEQAALAAGAGEACRTM